MRGRRCLVLLLLLCLSCFEGAKLLDKQEVNALMVIGAKLKIKWDFSVDPCSTTNGWVDPSSTKDVASNVTCNCNTATNFCHVINITLKAQNLGGVLPPEFAKLTHLISLDLTRNYLNGSIPAEWATLPLTNLSLLGNRITGTIPEELGNITTLQSLNLEANQLRGRIPISFGKLKNLTRFFLSANNISGELPDSLGNLTLMNDFRIDGNPISGKIPSFIGNWKQLNRLDMQGTNLEGPFPPNFATLSTITELRVTDLRGMNGEFLPLQKMESMKYLVLRNLSIAGLLPGFIGNMSDLKMLDLCFNNLSGLIPNSYKDLAKTNFVFLTDNLLSGAIPHEWISGSRQNLYIDLSYNRFNDTNTLSGCQINNNVNLFASYSSANNISTPCLQKDLQCSGKRPNFDLFINCGGQDVTVGKNKYEKDMFTGGKSNFAISENNKWACSNTGVFLENETNGAFIASTASNLNMTDSTLYTTARLSPLSLKYYGLCLQKGNYTINLHFAEIIFTNDQSYASVGKRLFDVSIQGHNVLTDFDIVKEADGAGKKVIKNFTTIVDGTLEIHFQWKGKGTNSIPTRGVYGPLVSAISVTPNFKPDYGGDNKLSVGAIIGIVAAICVVILFLLILLWFCFRRKPEELRGLELQSSYFTLRQVKAATKGFNLENKIGEGGFGPVYKGELPDGTLIAVKQLSSKSNQGNREFVNEIGMVSSLNHPNLVKLFGCCIEGNQLLLIYEYMENNSLARALFGPEADKLKLDWQTRRNICLDIARGLAYLHEESRLKIVHRDIKATNILLNKDLNAKISDFGLAKLNEGENTHISTRIAGTVGYMAPEYAMRGYLTDKADVYSFGVVMLEIVSGRSNTNYKPKEDFVYLLDWAYVLQEQGNLLELVDKDLESNYSEEEALQLLELSLLCANPSPTLRPTMSAVFSMLEGTTPVQVPPFKHDASKREDIRLRSIEKWSNESQTPSASIDGPWSGSSASAPSIKPETLHSEITTLLQENN